MHFLLEYIKRVPRPRLFALGETGRGQKSRDEPVALAHERYARTYIHLLVSLRDEVADRLIGLG